MNNMKKLFLAIIAVASLALPVNAQKFALVDMEYILNHIPAYERANGTAPALRSSFLSHCTLVLP